MFTQRFIVAVATTAADYMIGGSRKKRCRPGSAECLDDGHRVWTGEMKRCRRI